VVGEVGVDCRLTDADNVAVIGVARRDVADADLIIGDNIVII
jgi:hypothetical protein